MPSGILWCRAGRGEDGPGAVAMEFAFLLCASPELMGFSQLPSHLGVPIRISNIDFRKERTLINLVFMKKGILVGIVQVSPFWKVYGWTSGSDGS